MISKITFLHGIYMDIEWVEDGLFYWIENIRVQVSAPGTMWKHVKGLTEMT